MKRILLLAIAAAGLAGQVFTAFSTQTSVSSDKLTLAHVATAPARIQPCYAAVQATVDGTVTVEVGGAAATSTTATVGKVIPGGRDAKAVAWSASNVGAGTAVSIAYKLTANVPLPLDMRNIRLSGSGTTKNVTLVIALGSSGNVTSNIMWAEDGNCI
jgi:hypothetical protein